VNEQKTKPLSLVSKKNYSLKKFTPYIVIIIIGFITHGNTLNHGYVLDDMAIIANHKHVQNGLAGIPEILTTNYLHGVQEFNDGLYRPLSPVLFAVQNQISPNNTFNGHLFNVIYMILISIIMYHVLISVFKVNQNIALGLSALFLVIPVHTEVVANVKSSDELLALLFVLLSLWQFSKYISTKKNTSLVSGGVFFFIALFSKESTFTFVLIIPAVLYWLNKEKVTDLFRIVGVTGTLGLLFLWIRHAVLSSMPNEVDEGTLSALNNSVLATDIYLEKLGTALWMQVLYFVKTIIPYSLQHDYSFSTIEIVSLLSIKGIAGLILVALLGYSAWRYRKTDPIISVGIAWYFGSLVIVSNLVFPIGATFAERFVFTPSFGLVLVFFGILKKFKLDEEPKKMYTYAFIAIVGLYAIVSIKRNSDWKDNLTLYTADYLKLENSARGNYNYGTASQKQAEISKRQGDKKHYQKEAEIALNRAIEIYPDYWDAYNNLALVYQNNEQNDKAVAVLKQLTTNNPNYLKGWFNLGVNYYQLTDYPNALVAFNNYNNLYSNNPDAWYFKGLCLGYQNNFTDAILEFNQSIKLNPNHTNSLLMLGKAHGILGDYQKSKGYFERLLQIQPNNEDAKNNLKMTIDIIKSQSIQE
jgi:Tfp pilus assembly protein PilF